MGKVKGKCKLGNICGYDYCCIECEEECNARCPEADCYSYCVECENYMNVVPAVWKMDKELGWAYFCSKCKRVVFDSGECDCGVYVDMHLPMKEYKGRVSWENYRKGDGANGRV